MRDISTHVVKQVQLTAEHIDRLHDYAQARSMSEDEIINKALDLFFGLIHTPEEAGNRQEWSLLAEPALQRVWDNEADARYDNWSDLNDSPAPSQAL